MQATRMIHLIAVVLYLVASSDSTADGTVCPCDTCRTGVREFQSLLTDEAVESMITAGNQACWVIAISEGCSETVEKVTRGVAHFVRNLNTDKLCLDLGKCEGGVVEQILSETPETISDELRMETCTKCQEEYGAIAEILQKYPKIKSGLKMALKASCVLNPMPKCSQTVSGILEQLFSELKLGVDHFCSNIKAC